MKNQVIFILIILFNSLAFSQEKKIDQTLLDDACKCIKKIDYDLETPQKTDSIKACISGAIMASQMKNILNEVDKKKAEVTADTTVTKNLDFTIFTDENFPEIQKKLLDECPAVKLLLLSNNKKSKHSLSDNDKAMAFYREGEQYFSQGNYESALVQFNKAVKKDSKFAFAWDNLGICYRKLGRYKEAIPCYEKSLALDPKGTVPLGSLATAYELLKDYKNAAAAHLKMIEYYPENPEGYYGAGRMFYLDGQYEKGVDNICQAYMLYKKTNSPYIHDAEANIAGFYNDLKEKNQLEIFNKVAKKYNINITE
ncbi:MAG: tetratricopeptide repeat protein [Flavobacterium sp.]|nr:tetratricopeptide repeat protein [Flavobacterium sp.]